MTTPEVLKAARALISDPARWTQGAQARDKYGKRVHVSWPEAARWSLFGAVWHIEETRAGKNDAVDAAYAILQDLAGKCAFLADYNDTHTHADVLALFDRAIAAQEAAP